MRSGVILAPKDHNVGSRFTKHRNESSRMSMSMQSESGVKWPKASYSLTKPVSPLNQPTNFAVPNTMKNRNNSMYGTFQSVSGLGPAPSINNLDTRSLATRGSHNNLI